MALNEKNTQTGEVDRQTPNKYQDPQKRKIREGWAEAAQEAHENGDDKLLMDFPNDFDEEEWGQ